MNREEMNMLSSEMHNLTRQVSERLKLAADPAHKLSLAEMAMVGSIMRDLADAEKLLAKAHYYVCEHPVEIGPKY